MERETGKTKFQGFNMLLKRQVLQESKYDLTITSAYISLSMRAMKHLDVNVGDKIAMAACTDGLTQHTLIARSTDDKAFPIVMNKRVKSTTPIVYMSIAKHQPEIKGNYYLKEYGFNAGHEWWEVTKDAPDSAQPTRKFKFFHLDNHFRSNTNVKRVTIGGESANYFPFVLQSFKQL